MAETKTGSATYQEACEEFGLEERGSFPPFLDLYGKAGNWVTGEVLQSHEITYTAKKGKLKGKKITKDVYVFEVEKSNIQGVQGGDRVTISPAGLLAYQLGEDKPKGAEFPLKIGILFTGKDEEGRNQTKVSWPKE